MRGVQTIPVIVALLFSLTASAQDKQIHDGMNKIDPLPRDLEIQLAPSALPPQLRDNATVYVLNPDKGFEVARKGTNGFYALVARTGDDTFRGSWPLNFAFAGHELQKDPREPNAFLGEVAPALVATRHVVPTDPEHGVNRFQHGLEALW
jgi:hypothetical protein